METGDVATTSRILPTLMPKYSDIVEPIFAFVLLYSLRLCCLSSLLTDPLKDSAATGKPVAYKLVGTPNPLVFAHPQSMIGQRAQFAFKNLWVTPHSDQERYPAGDYTIGSHGGAGLSEWTKQVGSSLQPLMVQLQRNSVHVNHLVASEA